MNKLKFFFISVFALLMVGCAQTKVITKTELVSPNIQTSQYTCPVNKKFPNYKTLTDGEVAKLLVVLQTNNVICHDALESLKKHIEDTKTIIKDKKGK